MTDEALTTSVDAYQAVLLGGAEDVIDLLTESGLDLSSLLLTPDDKRDEITRSDLCELIAAGSVIADSKCRIDSMVMPNVPKMSRRKSDSGLDIVDVVLQHGGEPSELSGAESLVVVSIKHSVQASTSALRYALVESVSDRELTQAYLATQLRVLSARLLESGLPAAEAQRVYLFLRDFFQSPRVTIMAIGLTDATLVDDFRYQMSNLPETSSPNIGFRCIFVPDLPLAHERCA